jgi:hypothetical protein
MNSVPLIVDEVPDEALLPGVKSVFEKNRNSKLSSMQKEGRIFLMRTEGWMGNTYNQNLAIAGASASLSTRQFLQSEQFADTKIEVCNIAIVRGSEVEVGIVNASSVLRWGMDWGFVEAPLEFGPLLPIRIPDSQLKAWGMKSIIVMHRQPVRDRMRFTLYSVHIDHPWRVDLRELNKDILRADCGLAFKFDDETVHGFLE